MLTIAIFHPTWLGKSFSLFYKDFYDNFLYLVLEFNASFACSMFSIQTEARFWIIFNTNIKDQKKTWWSICAEFVTGERTQFLTWRIML